jgi:hypothetical protein
VAEGGFRYPDVATTDLFPGPLSLGSAFHGELVYDPDLARTMEFAHGAAYDGYLPSAPTLLTFDNTG